MHTSTLTPDSLAYLQSLPKSELTDFLKRLPKTKARAVLEQMTTAEATPAKPAPKTVNEYQRQYMSQRRAAERDIEVTDDGAMSDRRQEAAKDYLFGLKQYFPHKFDKPFTVDGQSMVAAIVDRAKFGGMQAIAGPRGEGKTTFAIHVAILAILHGHLTFPLIVGATGDHAAEILDTIKHELVTNDLLLEDFPAVCKVARYVESAPQRAMSATVNGVRVPIAWKADRIRLPNGAIVRTRGITAAFRGMNVRGKRPDLVILDDVDTRESAESEEQTTKRRNTIEQDISGLGGPGKKIAIVMLCTTINRTCLAYEYTDTSQKPAWRGQRYKLLNEMPDHPEMWDEYIRLRLDGMSSGEDVDGAIATQFYQDNREAMDAGAVVSNPTRYVRDMDAKGKPLELSPLQHIYNKIADGMRDGKDGWRHFNTEYQNDPPADEGPQTSGLTAELIRTRLSGIPRGIIPDEAQILTSGIDVGKRILHWTVAAWAPGARGWVVDYGTQDVYPRDMDSGAAVETAVRQALHRWREAVLAEPYRRKDGELVPVNLALVDAGYASDGVYAFVVDCGGRGVAPFHGVGDVGDKRAKLQSADGKEWKWYPQQSGVWLMMANADYWKTWLHERYLTPPDRHGSLSLFGSDRKTHISYSQHKVAEVEEVEFVQGRGLRKRWNKRSRDNHWFDSTYMASVAAAEKGIRLMPQPLPPTAARNRKGTPAGKNNRFISRDGGWVQGMK